MVNPLAIGSSIAAFVTSIYYLTSKDTFLFSYSPFDNSPIENPAETSSLSVYNILDSSISFVDTFTNENFSLVRKWHYSEEIDSYASQKSNQLNSFVQDDILINVYVPWFRPCQKLNEDFEIFSKKFYLSGTPIKLFSLDAQLYPDIATILNVRWYPSLIHIHSLGDKLELKVFPRNQERSFESIQSWLIETLPLIKPYKYLSLNDTNDSDWQPDFIYYVQLVLYNSLMTWIISWNEYIFTFMKEESLLIYSFIIGVSIFFLSLKYFRTFYKKWKYDSSLVSI